MESIEGCFPPTIKIYNIGLIELIFENVENIYEKQKKISMYPSDIRDIEFSLVFDNIEKRNTFAVHVSYYTQKQVIRNLSIYMYKTTTEKEARRFYNLLIKLKD